MNKTKIEWVRNPDGTQGFTWNPVTGCLHGCEYCYARKQAKRFSMLWLEGFDDADKICELLDKKMTLPGFEDAIVKDKNAYRYIAKQGFEFFEPVVFYEKSMPFPVGFIPTFHHYRLNEPQTVKRPSTIFVGSMTDLFGDWVPDEWIQEVFKACEAAPQHRYLFLTKNPDRYLSYYGFGEGFHFAPENWWLGASAETANAAHCSADGLGFVKANTFLSLEPLHEEVSVFIDYDNINWIIIGAESGNRKSKIIPCKSWIENIVIHCRAAGVPVFMKDSLADIWDESLIREWPW